jgi:hypothetical protein
MAPPGLRLWSGPELGNHVPDALNGHFDRFARRTVWTVLLTPRYDGAPALQVDGLISDPSIPLLRQRRRLARTLATLEPERWSSLTRCERWSVQDVVMHLVGINQVWQLSIAGARAGPPTRLFQNFDPAVTPAELVAAMP